MCVNRIAAREAKLWIRAGVRLVRTQVTEATREVAISVPPDLLGVRMQIPTISHPAESRLFLVEVCDRSKTVVVVVTAVSAVATIEDWAASAGPRN